MSYLESLPRERWIEAKVALAKLFTIISDSETTWRKRKALQELTLGELELACEIQVVFYNQINHPEGLTLLMDTFWTNVSRLGGYGNIS